MKLELIEDWHNFTKFWSVRFGVGSAFFSFLQLLMELGQYLPSLQGIMPSGPYAALACACAVASVISRAIAQNSLSEPAKDTGDANVHPE